MNRNVDSASQPETTERELSPEERYERARAALDLDPSIPLSPNEKVYDFDHEMAATWIEKEDRPDVKEIKQLLVDSIEGISAAEFLELVSEGSERVAEVLKDKRYGVILSDDAHKSERWVYELMKNNIPRAEWAPYSPPIASDEGPSESSIEPRTFFTHGFPDAIKKSIEEDDVDTFLFPDDIMYSGRQMQEKVSLFREWYKRLKPDKEPSIVIFAASATKGFEHLMDGRHINDLADWRKDPYSRPEDKPRKADITTVIGKPIRTTGETLGEKLHGKKIRLQRNDEKRLPPDAALVYAAHKMPDSWTFPNSVRNNVGLPYSPTIRPPHKEEATPYYEQEHAAYDAQKSQMPEADPRDLVQIKPYWKG